jgi:hypothetical protein
VLYRADEAAQRAEQLGLCKHKESISGGRQPELSSTTLSPNMPTIDVSYIQLQISHVSMLMQLNDTLYEKCCLLGCVTCLC